MKYFLAAPVGCRSPQRAGVRVCSGGEDTGRSPSRGSRSALWAMAGLVVGLSLPARAAKPGQSIDFNRDVRPILSESCFKCHGPDPGSREAKLRFDIPEPDGGYAFVPGEPDNSEGLKRIVSTDPDEQMPPDSHKRLTKAHVAILRRWVAEGAHYQPHWSFVSPQALPAPTVKNIAWSHNEIDRFVLARLEKDRLSPAAEADRATLLRRVSLDLTGLPPTLAEMDAFLADSSPRAYERVVDRLLASPRYGERMAVDWLDGARYSDTNGYFGDAPRQIWPWRNWVIDAFNQDMPYDRFTVDQLAGDLLPSPTMAQRIATGFNRNNMTNNESGLIDEEYRVEYVAERVETTGTMWLGLTIGCARCHDHKYDPVTQKEFYQLFSFFNNSPEKGLVTADDPPPVMDVATPEQNAELKKLVAAKRGAEAKLAERAEALREPMKMWAQSAGEELAAPREKLALYVDFEPEAPGLVEKGNVIRQDAGLAGRAAQFDGMQHVEASAELPFSSEKPWSIGVWLKPTGSLSGLLGKIEPVGGRRGFEVVWQKGRYQINFVNRWGVNAIELVTKNPQRSSDWQQLIVSYDGSQKAAGVSVYIDGKKVPVNITRDRLSGSIDNTEPLRIGRRDSGLGFYGQLDELRFFERAVNEQEAAAWYWSDRLRATLAAEKPDERNQKYLLDYYVTHHGDGESRAVHQAAEATRAAEAAFRALLPKTLVMEELPQPRQAHVLKRGKYDDLGEKVSPDVPAILPPFPTGAPRNRLGLAQWLVSPENPLTARVAMNRLWKQCFGEGLVATVNDFGAQGETPSHPELLDWLAVRFMDGGWTLKAMHQLMVMSATYRQSSIPTRELLARDPGNRLLARGPRFRLPAEMIRDQALAASGLLIDRVGGPSVNPYQPPGLWEEVTYDGETGYHQDSGEGLWRRSLYTYWKRQIPPPTMLTFDGPTREICTVSRPRTNTPLQALVLLNDVTYLEAGRALASATLSQPGDDPARIRYVFRRLTSRWPEAEEIKAVKALLTQQRASFAADPAAAKKLTAQGASTAGQQLDPVELAAWSVTAHALLNLDEVIVRR